MNNAWMLPAIVLIPLLGAAVVGLFRNTWSKTLVSWVACSTVGLSFAMVLALFYQFSGTHEVIRAHLTTWGPMLDFGLMADSLSLWWMLVVTGCGFLIHVYSTGYMWEDDSFGRFMAKLNFFIYAMSLLVLSDNFVGLLIGWANVGLASYMLIGFFIKKQSARDAAIKAFVMNSLGEIGLVAGIAYIYKTFGTYNYDKVFDAIKHGQGTEMLTLIGLLLLLGAVAKSAQLPLHTWLPYAMEGPTPVSALIHAATMVTGGVYLVSRAWPIYAGSYTASMTVAWIGALGALFGSVVALGQNDIKRVLAFSTMSQIGYMFLGNGLGAYLAADFHFFTHAFFKAALFLCAGIIVHHYNGDQDMRKMGGLWKEDKFAAITFGVAALALIGFPPFAGFFSKDEIIGAAFDQGQWALFGIAVLAAGFTALYNVRMFSMVFLGQQPLQHVKQLGKMKRAEREQAEHAAAHAHAHAHHGTKPTMSTPVGILAVLSVVGGFIAFPHWQTLFLERSFEGLTIKELPVIDWTLFTIVVGISVLGMVVGYLLYGPKGLLQESERDLTAKGGILLNMFYLDTIYEWVVIKPVMGLADWISDVADAKVVDGIVNGLAALAAAIGSALRALNSGYIRRYALTIFAGVALMLVYFVFYV